MHIVELLSLLWCGIFGDEAVFELLILLYVITCVSQLCAVPTELEDNVKSS